MIFPTKLLYVLSTHLFLRRLILSLAQNRFVSRSIRRYGMRLGAARFVAGETLEGCVYIPISRSIHPAPGEEEEIWGKCSGRGLHLSGGFQ